MNAEAGANPFLVPDLLVINALRVLGKRYLKKDKQGNVVETPDEMFRRVAELEKSEVEYTRRWHQTHFPCATAELIYDPKACIRTREEEFYRLMATLVLPVKETVYSKNDILATLI